MGTENIELLYWSLGLGGLALILWLFIKPKNDNE